jgi:hypothetical protein
MIEERRDTKKLTKGYKYTTVDDATRKFPDKLYFPFGLYSNYQKVESDEFGNYIWIDHCPSTHGGAGPYISPCPICGATIIKEEIWS